MMAWLIAHILSFAFAVGFGYFAHWLSERARG
jgi:hypothetical protein